MKGDGNPRARHEIDVTYPFFFLGLVNQVLEWGDERVCVFPCLAGANCECGTFFFHNLTCWVISFVYLCVTQQELKGNERKHGCVKFC